MFFFVQCARLFVLPSRGGRPGGASAVAEDKGEFMAVLGVFVAVLGAYLVYALLNPEKF